MKNLLIVVIVMFSLQSIAGGNGGGSPLCNGPGETKVSWPTGDPIWEMCYLAPSASSAADGSSLEIRDVYLNGYYAIERAHIPMLFANYDFGTCYRDWKDTNSAFLKPDQEEEPNRSAITTCDISTSPTQVVGNCPFVNLNGGGNVGSNSDCVTGVTVEKYEDRMVLTSNHSAAWYKYSSRYTFFIDGRLQPRFGFGNSTGTNSGITHWHHAYWRINFDIDGSANDEIYADETKMTTEFSDQRGDDKSTAVTWTVKDNVTNRGFRIEATAEDYLVDVDEAPNNPDNYHNVDVMGTQYRTIGSLTEYSDTPGSNNLGQCDMNENALINGASIDSEDVVFWYRSAVTDLANMGLVCKFAGPIFYPVGDWSLPVPDLIFKNDFD